ncbi:MAG TPA: S41 family peptidase [Vicinamibacterales bacterium]|nr:S41 family peptidase [Vicinamibacterales bacterium]
MKPLANILRSRVGILMVSAPVLAFAIVGGLMGNARAEQAAYRPLAIFEDVVNLILNNYVEEVQVDKVMLGAMHGLADGLDPDSAFLDVNQVRVFEKNDATGAGGTGIELTRQYYLRVIAARDGSPAARAGLRAGDYIRAIDGQSTRDTSVYEGMRMLAGKPGSQVTLAVLRGNAAEPHTVELVREDLTATAVRGRLVPTGVGYLRVAEFSKATPDQIRNEVATLAKGGATRLVLDLRGTAFGDVEAGLAAARLFVANGTLGYRQERGKAKEAVTTAAGDGSIALPVALLTDNGTSGPAELFAAALTGNKRASSVGERTLGRAARQRLVRLPDGSGLLLTHLFYLTPSEAVINEKGLTPDVAVEQPDVDFGQPAPTSDPTLDKAVEHLKAK